MYWKITYINKIFTTIKDEILEAEYDYKIIDIETTIHYIIQKYR